MRNGAHNDLWGIGHSHDKEGDKHPHYIDIFPALINGPA